MRPVQILRFAVVVWQISDGEETYETDDQLDNLISVWNDVGRVLAVDGDETLVAMNLNTIRISTQSK